jgi:hypothetical protein
MTARRLLTRADILAPAQYAAERRRRRAEMAAFKKNRRVEVGPFATFYFENFATMWHQVHEMLAIEKGGEAQIEDELAAYNPLIPQGDELVATVMFEIEDPVRRARILERLGGVEGHFFFGLAGEQIRGRPEAERENTRADDGKASSVQFVHFPFTAAQKTAFSRPGTQILLGIDHANYGHMAVVPEGVRAALAEDFA